MNANWLGIVANEHDCAVVHGRPSTNPLRQLHVVRELTWTANSRASYDRLYAATRGYIKAHGIDAVVIKDITLGRGGGARAVMFKKSELCGCVIAATASLCPLFPMKKGVISKMYGDRKFDEFVKDLVFWRTQVEGEISPSHREAAMFIIAARRLCHLPHKLQIT